MDENKKNENKWENIRNIGLVILFLAVFIISRFFNQWLVNSCNRIFEEYNGPVMPLSVMSDAEGIEAERNLVLDFAAYEKVLEYPDTAVRKIAVTDGYKLTNTTGEDIRIKAVYPFAGKLMDELGAMPVLSVNGERIETDLTVGREVSRYVDMHKANGDTSANQLYGMNSREAYSKLLSDGSYKKDAFEAAPDGTASVKVYQLKDLAYDGEYIDEMRPMVKVQYARNREKTVIIPMGASIYGGDDTIQYEYYDLPQKGEDGYGEDAYMVVLGEDVSDMELYYWDERHGELLEGVSIEVEEYNSTLGDVMEQLVIKKRDLRSEKDWIAGTLSDEELKEYFLQFFYDIGAHTGKTMVGLDDLYYTYSDARVMYLAFEVMIPAGKTVELEALFERMESLVDADGTECGGYDMVTTLDSDLTFTKQTVELTSTEYVTFVDDKGEPLEENIEEIELDTQEEGFEVLLQK